MPALYQPTRLIGSAQCQLTETTVHRQKGRSARTYNPDSQPDNLCCYSLELRAQNRCSKYKFQSIWFDQAGIRNPRYIALEACTLTLTPPVRFRRRIDNTITKKKTKKKHKTKNIVLKILNRKIKIEPHELHLKPG